MHFLQFAVALSGIAFAMLQEVHSRDLSTDPRIDGQGRKLIVGQAYRGPVYEVRAKDWDFHSPTLKGGYLETEQGTIHCRTRLRDKFSLKSQLRGVCHCQLTLKKSYRHRDRVTCSGTRLAAGGVCLIDVNLLDQRDIHCRVV